MEIDEHAVIERCTTENKLHTKVIARLRPNTWGKMKVNKTAHAYFESTDGKYIYQVNLTHDIIKELYKMIKED